MPDENATTRGIAAAAAARDRALSGLDRARAQTLARIDEGRDALIDAGGRARDGLVRSQIEATDFVRRHPVASIAGALAFGILVGALWPSDTGAEPAETDDADDVTGV